MILDWWYCALLHCWLFSICLSFALVLNCVLVVLQLFVPPFWATIYQISNFFYVFGIGCLVNKVPGDLKEHVSNSMPNISIRVEKVSLDLKATQQAARDQLGNTVLQIYANRLRKEAHTLCKAERRFFCQQAKRAYLKSSDRCTKFFHAIVKRNAKSNFEFCYLFTGVDTPLT